VTEQTKSSISLADGGYFDFKAPELHKFEIDVIAHALSNICRYTGHSRKFYSVAEHSVIVSRLVPAKYALEGLLHDASEAYTGDVSSPLKALLPGYRKIEDRVQEAISVYFGLRFPFPEEVHLADKQAYRAERETVASNGVDSLWYTDERYKTNRDCMPYGLTPKNAKQAFLNRFYEITNEKKERTSLRRKGAPSSKAA
jgi:uncharacterized protein